jgi:hypothetical protein
MTVSDLLEQPCNILVISWLYQTCWNNLATSPIISTRTVNKLFQTCWQLGTSSHNFSTTRWQTCYKMWDVFGCTEDMRTRWCELRSQSFHVQDKREHEFHNSWWDLIGHYWVSTENSHKRSSKFERTQSWRKLAFKKANENCNSQPCFKRG